MKSTTLIAAAIFGVGLAVQAQSVEPEASLTQNPIYQKNCAKCHGKSAEGRFMAGPSLHSGKVTALSTDDLRNIITNGRKRMPKFGEKLSGAEIDTLVGQIQDQAKQK